MTVKLLENIKTGRRFIATPELLKRPDMRAVTERTKTETIVDDSHDKDYLGDGDLGQADNPNGIVDANIGGTGEVDGDEADNDGDESETSGGSIDLSKFSDDDLIAFANAEPYKLNAKKSWKRETVESKLLEMMGG